MGPAVRAASGGGGAQMPKSRAAFGGGPVTWGTFALFGLVGGGTAFYVHLEREKRRVLVAKRQAEARGAAAIGGPFELVDVDGKAFHSEQLKGNWVLLYFGFTFCPDICPEELDKVTACLDILDAQPGMPEVVPVFISIDPHRDTPAKVKEYLKDFHPRMVGLTGTEAQVKAAAKTYRVYYSKPSTDDSDDYLVDHSIVMYLVNPEGQFCSYYGQLVTAEKMADGIAKEVEASQLSTDATFMDILLEAPRKLFS